MKKLYYVLFLMAVFGLAACNQDDEIALVADEHADEVLVKLNLGMEISSDYSPLTRAGSTDDLIGIQIDRIKSDGSVEAYFAYGLFDRLDGISVYLKKEYTYKITATLVKDGKTKLKNNTYDNVYPFYCGPSLSVGSSFNYSSYYFLPYLSESRTTLPSGNVTNYPQVDRLYGETTITKPAVGGVVNLEMKRVSFGLKYEVSGLDEGTLNVKIVKKAPNANVFVDATGVENGYKGEVNYYTFTEMKNAYDRADSYYESFKVTVSHTHDIIGVTEPLGSVDVKIYRNKLNNIRINLNTVAGAKGKGGIRPDSTVSMDYEDIME